MSIGYQRVVRFLMMLIIVLITGCGGVPELPESFDVATSTNVSFPAAKQSGPVGFANTSWTLSREADSGDTATQSAQELSAGPYGGILNGQGLERPGVGEQLFIAHFSDQGDLLKITENNFFLPQFYGLEIDVGDAWITTTLPGVSYRSASYGVEREGRFGLAIVAQVRFVSTLLGTAVLYSWGTRAGDTLDGQFGYVLDFTRGFIPFLNTVADQYPVNGERVSD